MDGCSSAYVWELALGILYSLLSVPPFMSLRTTVAELYALYWLSCSSVRYIHACFHFCNISHYNMTLYASCYKLCALWNVLKFPYSSLCLEGGWKERREELHVAQCSKMARNKLKTKAPLWVGEEQSVEEFWAIGCKHWSWSTYIVHAECVGNCFIQDLNTDHLYWILKLGLKISVKVFHCSELGSLRLV